MRSSLCQPFLRLRQQSTLKPKVVRPKSWRATPLQSASARACTRCRHQSSGGLILAHAHLHMHTHALNMPQRVFMRCWKRKQHSAIAHAARQKCNIGTSEQRVRFQRAKEAGQLDCARIKKSAT